jgi:hypothetical protein
MPSQAYLFLDRAIVLSSVACVTIKYNCRVKNGKQEKKVTLNLERRNESTWMVLMNAIAPSGITMYVE